MKTEKAAVKHGAYALLREKRRRLLKMTLEKPPTVRVAPGSYIAALLIGNFAAFALYFALGAEAAKVFALITWLVVPFLAWTDCLAFDGKTLRRRGVLPFIIEKISERRMSLRLAEIETVETDARRTIERDGKVFYLYQTTIKGAGRSFSFNSGGAKYRRFIKSLLGSLSDEKLDLRSIDLCYYLAEPEAIRAKLNYYKVPSAEFLSPPSPSPSKQSVKKAINLSLLKVYGVNNAPEEIRRRAENLHVFANELRIEGRLRQSAELFRRALQLAPENARLLFDYARCLHSLARTEDNAEETIRARAVLRLAQKRTSDAKLLSHIGQSFLHFGDMKAAERIFTKLKDSGKPVFRAERGLAEISIGRGKIAHAIHHFAESAQIAPNIALRNWARREADYFQKLNYDEAYLSAEIKRIDLLTDVREGRRSLWKFIISSVLIAVGGAWFNWKVAVFGVSCAASLIVAWFILTIAKNFLDRRKVLTGE